MVKEKIKSKAKETVKKAAKTAAKAVAKVIMAKIVPILLPILIVAFLIVVFFVSAAGIKESSSSSDGSSSVDGFYGDTIQEKVWWALKDAGYSDEQVAGVMGNIYAESSFNSSAVNPSSGASGLCQWLYGRKTQLCAYAESKGVEWTDEETQIEYLIGELDSSGNGANGYATYQLSGNDSWLRSTTVEGATRDFYNGFERGGDSQYGGTKRPDAAQKYYDQFHNASKPSSETNTKSGTEKLSNTPGIRGYYKAACSGRTFTEYYQNDGGAWDWKYGCWVTSQATIMSGFGSKYTPNQLPGFHGSAQQYTWKQYGGVQYERVTNVKAGEMKNWLKKGHVLHIRVEGRYLITDNDEHYFDGHSLTVLDYKREGGKDRVYIHDPYKTDLTYGWTDLNKLAGCLNWYEHVWK